MEIRMIFKDGGQGLDEVLDAFFCAQAADVANERGAVGIGDGDGEGGEVEEVAVGDEDFVATIFEVPFTQKFF
jgi:hypothetical protein